MTDVNEQVISTLGLQVGQLTIDRAFAEARLNALLGLVRDVLMATEWTEDTNGCRIAVPPTESYMALHAAVLGPSATASYAPVVVHQEVPDPPA